MEPKGTKLEAPSIIGAPRQPSSFRPPPRDEHTKYYYPPPIVDGKVLSKRTSWSTKSHGDAKVHWSSSTVRKEKGKKQVLVAEGRVPNRPGREGADVEGQSETQPSEGEHEASAPTSMTSMPRNGEQPRPTSIAEEEKEEEVCSRFHMKAILILLAVLALVILIVLLLFGVLKKL